MYIYQSVAEDILLRETSPEERFRSDTTIAYVAREFLVSPVCGCLKEPSYSGFERNGGWQSGGIEVRGQMEKHRNTDATARFPIAIFLLLLTAAAMARGQQTTGDILGTVTDTTGAIVASATVSVENAATHETRKVVTSSTGDYVVNLLNQGNYSVSVSAAGFEKFVVSSVVLAAGDRVRVNAQLAVGETSETITVESEGSALKTDSSVLSTTITPQETQDLPLNGRNFVQLIQLAPGVNEGPPTSLTNGTELDDRRQSAAISVNGQSDVLNNEMMDGADNNERLIGTVAVRPSVEAISELSVQTNTYTAEVGRTGGGIINVITKSGSDRFHGSVFEFLRNDVLNANPFNFGAKLPKPEDRWNQFGASLGGPIKKSKTFFFGDYEGYRYVQGTAPGVYPVPTLFEEQNPGNFSDIGGPTLTKSQIDPVALDYFSMFPAPNSGSNFVAGYKNVQNSTDYDARIDHQFNPSDLMYGRFAYNKVYTDSPGPFPDVSVGGLKLNPNFIGYALGNATDLDFNGLLDYVHTFNGNLLLELKASYTRSNNQSYPETDGQNPNEAFGQPNVNTPISDSTGLAPIVVLSGADLGNVLFQPLKDQDNTFQYLGAVTYTRGAHNIKIGASVIRRQLTSFQSSYPEGLWIFLDYPGLLQGQYVNTQRSLQLVVPHLRVWEPAVYVQDDWHARKNLTLNLGVRFDHYTPYTEIANRISTWDPTAASLLVAGRNGVSNTAGIHSDYHGIAPRIGFAYTAAPGLVISGGFGIGYFPMNTTSNANMKDPPFVATVSSCGYFSCGAGYSTFADGFPVPTATSITVPGSSIPDAVSPRFRTSYMEQFNLTVQKDWNGNVLTASYVGLLGRELMQLLPDLNAPPPNACGSNAACYDPLRPYYGSYPNLGQIGFMQSGGKLSYNALETSFERRLKNGLAFNVNYSWAHDLDNQTGESSEGDNGYGSVPSIVSKRDYGNSTLDVGNRIAATTDYQLPFGKDATGPRALATAGWHVNVIDVWSVGQPFTVVNASNVSNTNPGSNATDRPNQVGSWKLSNPGIGADSTFFNVNAFAGEPAGTLGDERREQLFGPRFRHLDFSTFKVFRVNERLNVEFRAECFNVTNTTNFAPPNAQLGGALFGSVTSTIPAYTPRQIQFALKLTY